MEINERYIQVSGKLATDQTLEHGDTIKVSVTVVAVQDNDNQDGTLDRTYKCKLLTD